MTAQQLSVLPDSFAIPAPNFVNSRSLAANTAESITVPSDRNLVVFSATADFYANYTATAAVPGDVTDGTASELNPTVRSVAPGSTISVISPSACVVTAAFYNQ